MAAYEATLKPTSKADFYADVDEAIEEYKRGESIPLETVHIPELKLKAFDPLR
jgi:hypothetical protein